MRWINESRRPILLLLFVFASTLAAAIANHSFAEQEPSEQEASEVAQKLLKIQQEMGGSVVKLPAEVSGLGSMKPGRSSENITNPTEAKDPVFALREAALQLDLLAHRLELLDLYPQADAARELAQSMRTDARQLRQAETAVKPD